MNRRLLVVVLLFATAIVIGWTYLTYTLEDFKTGASIVLEPFEHHDKAVTALFTLVLAISTVGLWVATFFVWRSGEKQIDLARQNATRQLRAYLSLTKFRVTGTRFAVGDRPALSWQLENNGLTPAYDVVIKIDAVIVPADFVCSNENVTSVFAPFMLDPRKHVGQDYTFEPLTAEQAEGLRTGKLRIIVYGQVDYRDAFDNLRIRSFRLVSDEEVNFGSGPTAEFYLGYHSSSGGNDEKK